MNLNLSSHLCSLDIAGEVGGDSSAVKEVVEESEIAVDILAYMTDQRKEYSDDYNYEDYIDSLDDNAGDKKK